MIERKQIIQKNQTKPEGLNTKHKGLKHRPKGVKTKPEGMIRGLGKKKKHFITI